MSATAPQIPTGTWTVDPVHSTAGFAVRHMVVSNYRTTFKEIDATLELDGDDARLTGRVPVQSIDVSEPNLRGHLLSPEFFDADSHPHVTFASRAVRRGGDGALEVEGDLTIKGITRRVTGIGELNGPATDPYGNERVGVELQTVVDRTQFGLNWNAPLPGGGVAVANDVTLTIHLEFTKA